jgi:hypothetical protein
LYHGRTGLDPHGPADAGTKRLSRDKSTGGPADPTPGHKRLKPGSPTDLERAYGKTMTPSPTTTDTIRPSLANERASPARHAQVFRFSHRGIAELGLRLDLPIPARPTRAERSEAAERAASGRMSRRERGFTLTP